MLEQSGTDEVRLTFEEIERRIGSPLPASARGHHAWWHESQPSGRAWKERGWRATARLSDAEVIFRRTGMQVGDSREVIR